MGWENKNKMQSKPEAKKHHAAEQEYPSPKNKRNRKNRREEGKKKEGKKGKEKKIQIRIWKKKWKRSTQGGSESNTISKGMSS